MAECFTRLKNMKVTLDALQEKEDAVATKKVHEPSSESDDTSSPPHESSEVLKKLAETFGELIFYRMISYMHVETSNSNTTLHVSRVDIYAQLAYLAKLVSQYTYKQQTNLKQHPSTAANAARPTLQTSLSVHIDKRGIG